MKADPEFYVGRGGGGGEREFFVDKGTYVEGCMQGQFCNNALGV